MVTQELKVLAQQKVNTGIKSSDFIVEAQRKITSNLSNFPILCEAEAWTFLLCQRNHKNLTFLGYNACGSDFTLNFFFVEACKS